ncbi:hypothetical protein TcasGA2_TC014578 [Tribolium castaneum]|uniref:Uncharacterized protein n=1 Tax=Tribolium castaneum TaxID=7070 RepID=D6WMK9_TRICA|nr:hypothetical protein TcasGA2_TC014578 [Tribolium castaneum]
MSRRARCSLCLARNNAVFRKNNHRNVRVFIEWYREKTKSAIGIIHRFAPLVRLIKKFAQLIISHPSLPLQLNPPSGHSNINCAIGSSPFITPHLYHDRRNRPWNRRSAHFNKSVSVMKSDLLCESKFFNYEVLIDHLRAKCAIALLQLAKFGLMMKYRRSR